MKDAQCPGCYSQSFEHDDDGCQNSLCAKGYCGCKLTPAEIDAVLGSHQKAFFRASYALAKASDFDDGGPIVERVDVEFGPLSSVGYRPTASHMREVRAYLDFFPGHELDEDGRLKRIDAAEGQS